MSQENVEIVRAFIDAFNQGDLEAAFKHMDSDFEFDVLADNRPCGWRPQT